ncbi:MAG: Rid family hydrolase, partial [Pseudomonadota bacterium]
MRALNPEGAPKPASGYAQCVIHSAGAERIVISGQVGVRADGTIVEGLEAQTEQVFENIFAVLENTGFKREDLVKIV